jgi:adenosyl cobinamide kinase/adenosyl cobinamide phosphate guanylyltransferase
MIALALVLSLAALLISLAAALSRGKIDQADAEMTARIAALQANREHMKLLEEQYRTINASVRAALDLTAVLVQALAPLTRLNADDRIAQFIADIQRPGAPDEEQPKTDAPTK